MRESFRMVPRHHDIYYHFTSTRHLNKKVLHINYSAYYYVMQKRSVFGPILDGDNYQLLL